MVNKARQGSRLEQQGCKDAVEAGALLAGRFAASKNWGRFKIDTVSVFLDRVVLTQYKKGKATKKEREELLELGRLLPKLMKVEVVLVEKIKEKK